MSTIGWSGSGRAAERISTWLMKLDSWGAGHRRTKGSPLFCQSALPGRVFAELPREELCERPHPRRYQAPLRHHGVDAAVGGRMVRQHDLQAAGAEGLAHVPGRMQI